MTTHKKKCFFLCQKNIIKVVFLRPPSSLSVCKTTLPFLCFYFYSLDNWFWRRWFLIICLSFQFYLLKHVWKKWYHCWHKTNQNQNRPKSPPETEIGSSSVSSALASVESQQGRGLSPSCFYYQEDAGWYQKRSKDKTMEEMSFKNAFSLFVVHGLFFFSLPYLI
jgi:hypothetical protein